MATPLRVFDFTKSSGSGDGKISFSRGSEASFYGSDGYLHFAQDGNSALNLLTDTQDFSLGPWAKIGTTVTTSNDVLNSSETEPATKLIESNNSGEHRISQSLSVDQGNSLTISIYVKAGTASKVHFCFMNSASYTGGNPGFRFDLNTGKFISISSNTTSYQAINSGNGWWRLKVTGVPDLGTSSGMHLYILSDSNSFNYQGSTGKYVYLWGAQFEPGSALSDYTPAAAAVSSGGLRYNYDPAPSTPKLIGALIEPAGTNLVPYSQQLSHAMWRKQYVTIAAGAGKAPDGTNTAFKIKEDTRSSSQHYIIPNPSIATSAGSTYTFSAFLKAAERKWAFFNLNEVTVHFDLVNGTIGNYNDIFTPRIEDAGNGWFRCSATFKVNSSSTTTKIGPEPGNGQPSYSGNGSSGILAWGVQFEKNNEPTSYIRTQSTKASRSADIVTLTKPSGSKFDIFIQRKNGGVWINDIGSNYQIPPSTNEVKIANFYGDSTTSVKDETAQTLFSHLYENTGVSNTRVMIYDTLYMSQTPNKSWSLQRAINKTSPIFRFQVNSGDKWSGDLSNPRDKERCELYMKNGDLPFNKDVWISFAVRIAQGTSLNLSPSDFCYLGQFHATEDSGEMSTGPVLGIRLEGADTIRIYTASSTQNPIKKDPTYIARGSGKFARGVWHRMVLRIRFSATNGQVQWWQNGKELLNMSGIGIGYVDKLGPYFKFGIYRSAMTPSLSVEYANMEVEYNSSLISRVTQPLVIA